MELREFGLVFDPSKQAQNTKTGNRQGYLIYFKVEKFLK